MKLATGFARARAFAFAPAAAALAVCALPLLSLPAAAQLDPSRVVDAFEGVFGKQAGFRRSGAKGVCAVGEFGGNEQGRALSSASAFSGRPVPVVARFSVGGGNPKAADNAKSVRGLALAFDLPAGEVWQLAQAGDNVNSAVLPLPAERAKVSVGTLTIRQVEAGAGGACANITFNPTALPKGVEPSADPILAARAAPYAVSLGRRLTEGR